LRFGNLSFERPDEHRRPQYATVGGGVTITSLKGLE